MKKVSFEEIGSIAATFYAGEGVQAGRVVKLDGGETVGPCGAGERFCGLALSVSPDGCAGVQVGGFAAVAFSGDLTPGYVRLTGDGLGGVKAAGADDEAGEHLVVSAEGALAVVLL